MKPLSMLDLLWWGYLCKYQLDVNIPPVWPYMEFWWNSEDQPNGFLRIIIGKKFLFQSCLAKLHVAGFKPMFLVFRISCTNRKLSLRGVPKCEREHGVEIIGFFCHSDFTWNQFLENACRSSNIAFFEVWEAFNFVNLINFSI